MFVLLYYNIKKRPALCHEQREELRERHQRAI